MAMTKCGECGHMISDQAKLCPNCGIKTPRMSRAAKMLVVFFVLGAAVMLYGQHGIDEQQKKRQADLQALQQEEAARRAELTEEEKKAEDEKNLAEIRARAKELEERRAREQGVTWTYSTQEDPMGRGKVSHAYIMSTNSAQFDFPYHGGQRARLHLRDHPENGYDVILAVERGQFLCRSDDCSITARFDDGKPIKYKAVEPADMSTDTLFIIMVIDFTDRLKAASRLTIEAPFFQEGNRIFNFTTAGLSWPPK